MADSVWPGYDLACIACGASCRAIDRFCSQCGRTDPTGRIAAEENDGDELLTSPTLISDADGNLESATFFNVTPDVIPGATAIKSTTAPSSRRDKTRETKAQLDLMLAPGSVFGRRYRVQRFLGSGAMGYVCAAVDESIDEMVALKILSVPIHADPEAFERFKLELKLARKIRHRNVVQSFDLGFADNFPFISMEYIDADNLLKHLSRVDAFEEKDALAIMRQILRGLRAAHDLGIIHRDIKPENILVNKDGMAFITDFGIATSAEAVRRKEMAGTPDYMAPEQLRCEPVAPASDLYSCGVLLYRMLAGVLPYDATTLTGIMDAHLHAKPNPLPESAAVSSTTRELIEWMLQKKIADRPQDAASALEQIELVLRQATARSAARRLTALVIEHDHVVTEMMKRTLEAEGYRVVSADTAKEGVTLAFEQSPSIIFLDARIKGGYDLAINEEASAPQFDRELSGADALGVSRILRQDEKLRGVPIILMTDKTLSNLDRAFEQTGVNDVMLKPLKPVDVVDAAKRASGAPAS